MNEQVRIQILKHFDRETALSVTVVPFDGGDDYELTFTHPDEALQDIHLLSQVADVYL